MHTFDVLLFRWLNASDDSPLWLIQATAWYSEHFPTLAISSMLLCLVFGSSKLRLGVVACFAAMLLAWCLTHLIRWGFPMERPYDLGLGTKWVEHGSRPRFPSLHATVSFAFACGMARWCAAGQHAQHWRVLFWAVAALMGWSRIYIGVHLPLDVIAGLPLGMASVYLVQMLPARLRPLGRSAAYWSRQAAPWARHK